MIDFIMTDGQCAGIINNRFGNYDVVRYYHLSYRLNDLYVELKGDFRKIIIQAILEKDANSEIFQPVNTTFLFSTGASNVENWFCYLKSRVKELIEEELGEEIQDEFFLMLSLIACNSNANPVAHFVRIDPNNRLNSHCQTLIDQVKTDLEI